MAEAQAEEARGGGVGAARHGLGILLAVLTLVAYAGAGELGFVTLDDPGYVTQNRDVQAGLGLGGVVYAFTSTTLANWHPVTWLSHMAVVEVAGLEPAAHHWANVFLHVANVVLLFALLTAATGAAWRSAFVAALFGVHPLHVESVAWVAERKDVLSTTFWLLATLAYVRYAERRSRAHYWRTHYWGAVALTALGLMSKAMLVTLPFTLLLLDLWPLRRWRPGAPDARRAARRLLVEKVPFFALVFVFSVVTFVVQQRVGAVGSAEVFPLATRLANAVQAYGAYLWKTAWPVGLSVFYPYATANTLAVAASGSALVAATWVCWRRRAREPELLVGWLWFLGTLVPVIGLVQVGNQAWADRYTYVPHVGLFVAVTWGLARLAGRVRRGPAVALVSALVVLGVCTVLTREQVARWKDDETLFSHALRVTDDNYVAHDFYGRVLRQSGRVDEAMAHYREAMRIKPDFTSAYHNLSVALLHEGDFEATIALLETALERCPPYSGVYSNLAIAYEQVGRWDEALQLHLRAARESPRDAVARSNLARAHLIRNQVPLALEAFREALAIEPKLAWKEQSLDFAWRLATDPRAEVRDGAEAVELAGTFVDRVGRGHLRGLETLAAAYAEVGRFEEAAETAQEALVLARGRGNGRAVTRLTSQLASYRARMPLRSSGS